MSMRWLVEAERNPALGAGARVHTHVLWAGGLAHDVPDEPLRTAWRDTALHLVVGDRDAFATPAWRANVETRLADIGVHPVAHAFAGGHRLDTPLLGSAAAGNGSTAERYRSPLSRRSARRSCLLGFPSPCAKKLGMLSSCTLRAARAAWLAGVSS